MPGGIHAECEYCELTNMQELVNNHNMWDTLPSGLKKRTSLYLDGLDAHA